MFELIYRSTAKEDINSTDIDNILKIAREFNSKHEITGCLLFHNNEFIQILEGEKKLVQDLFKNIEKDERHSNVLLLAESEKKERLFKHWNMAFHEIDQNDVNSYSKSLFIDNFLTIAELTEKPTYAIELFWFISKKLVSKQTPPN